MRFAVIPTHDRPDDYRDAVAAISPQVDTVITVAHRCDYATGTVVEYEPVSPNISAMWNLGLELAGDHHVAVLNDDVIVPPNWFDEVARQLDAGAAGASGPRCNEPSTQCIAGYAFALDGAKRIRADERLVWWYSDDQIQRCCEQAGGFKVIPDLFVEHRYPNSTTNGRLADQAARDQDLYLREYRNAR